MLDLFISTIVLLQWPLTNKSVGCVCYCKASKWGLIKVGIGTLRQVEGVFAMLNDYV